MSEEQTNEIKYSYSRLETLDQCGWRYLLHYIEKHYPTTSAIQFDFGTAIHSIEEEIGNLIKDNKQIDYEALKTKFADNCAKIQQKYPEAFIEPDKTGRTYSEKINFYLNTGIYRLEKFMKENPELEVVGTEVKFKFRYCNNQIFKGSIDRVLKNKYTNKYIIQDIKTYTSPIEEDKLKTPLQFVTYCIAACELYHIEPQDISCSYDLPLCDKVQQAGTNGFIERGCKKLDKLFVKIEKEDYVPKPSPLCHWCEYCSSNDAAGNDTKFLCPYMSKWTRETKDFSKEYEWMGKTNHQAIFEDYQKRIAKNK